MAQSAVATRQIDRELVEATRSFAFTTRIDKIIAWDDLESSKGGGI
jgi:hypothetical protein